MLKSITTKQAPQPIGPYSQAIKYGKMVFVSGQIPIEINSNNIKGDIEHQTTITLKHIKTIIEHSGLKIKDIIKTTIFLTDINQLETVNKVYKNFFIINESTTFPARSCVQVSSLPNNAKIEIEVIAMNN
ncbi:RidA family protein [Buchnera aphidicola]|uniref:RidA family protein n=1 Tax=Buchnera aphidicola TaxID=9 RepID=UPI0031B8247F